MQGSSQDIEEESGKATNIIATLFAAVNILLSMSDANSTPQRTPSRGQNQHLSDEALARSLAMEEDEAYARAQAAHEERRYQAQQQGQAGGRRMGGNGGGLQSLFGGRSEAGGVSTSGRGGGGAASFFKELTQDFKETMQPLLDGKGPLSRQHQQGEGSGGGGLWDSPSPSNNTYDATQLTYQPRVRKGGPAGGVYQPPSGPPPSNTSTPSNACNWSRPSQQPQYQQQQQQQTPIRLFGGGGGQNNTNSPPANLTTRPSRTQVPGRNHYGSASAALNARYGGGAAANSPRTPVDNGKSRAISSSTRSGALGATAGLAGGAAAASTAEEEDDLYSSPPPSVASVLQQGGHRRSVSAEEAEESHHSIGGDDEDSEGSDDDGLEFQKSPFDDED